MKKRIMALILSAAVMLCMCGCDMDEFTQPVISQVGLGFYSNSYEFEVKKTDSKIINKCFEKIQIGPAVLTLPMNVSDLPEEISLSFDDDVLSLHNGFKTVFAYMYVGKSSIAQAAILCTDEEDLTDGVVMSLGVSSLEANAVFGDLSLDMRLDEIDKAMGHSGDYSDYCIYTSSDKKAILLGNSDNIDRAGYVCLSADPDFLTFGG